MAFFAVKRFVPASALQRYHFFLAALAALRHGFPSRRLTVIGVTGTDGKTTVVHLLHEMFIAAGHRVGSLSSLRFKINEVEEPNRLKMTMPGRFRLQRFLADCQRAGCRFAIIEVTSQGIIQSRHRFIWFRAGVLTNITPEHIESHGGFEQYRAAKLELFRRLPASGLAVLNREDASAGLFASGTKAEAVWYSQKEIEVKRVGHPVRLLDISPRRMQLEIDGRLLETGIGGAFNSMNVLAAAAAALAFDVSLSAIAAAMEGFRGMAGRLEYIQEKPFAAVVDYANTPSAYEKVYRALAHDGSRLICVFGAPGGGRDRWKRPQLGEIASRYCKEVILTVDDADDETPARIASDIKAGIPDTMSAAIRVILDRRQAIRAALDVAGPGDSVIITGMGAQPWIVIDGKKIPWDDRQVVREELARLSS